MSSKEKIQESRQAATEKEKIYEVILFNDDVHTFDFVIDTLMEVCGHDLLQAEQCTLLVHYKGKAAVKHGSYDEMKAICTGLLDRGLSAEIL